MPRNRDSLGWVYYKKGNHSEALKELKRAVELTGDDPVIFEHLGDVYIKLNRISSAIDSWNESLKYHEKEKGLKERVEKKIKQHRITQND
jgi:tetratricopeptide (TPR) repeat protein